MSQLARLVCLTDRATCLEQSAPKARDGYSVIAETADAVRYGYLGSAFSTGLGAVMGTSPASFLVFTAAHCITLHREALRSLRHACRLRSSSTMRPRQEFRKVVAQGVALRIFASGDVLSR